MTSDLKRKRIEQFERSCRERGLPVTTQRRTILEMILDREDHPTADQLYDQVRRRIHTISRTTVYRILDTLVELGLITKICHHGSAARFDPKIHQHHHLVCLHCETIIDLEENRLNEVTWPDVRGLGFEILDYNIHFRGVCALPEEVVRERRHAERKEKTNDCRRAAQPEETVVNQITEEKDMRSLFRPVGRKPVALLVIVLSGLALLLPWARSRADAPSSYAPVVIKEPFETTKARMEAAKPEVMKRQMDLLAERYDLSDRPAKDAKMSRGKAIQEGVRVKLPGGLTWDKLAAMSADEIKGKGLFPKGFLPLPHPNHAEGGMVFPQQHIDEIKKQEGRDLTRFDLDYDLPAHFLPEFPPAIYLTTRPDLGDVSQGKLVTIMNYYELFNGILNPKQLEGLRLLVTPFPQQQFNATEDRRSALPHRGVTCFDCHVNGHTNAATHLVGDIRPQEFRHGLDTPSLRGVNIQRLFGSQRALKSVEDFTEFEQRAAYFDGDPVIATKKGVNILERGSQVHFMAEFQALLDFPPAPKLDVFGKLDPTKATESELRGQEVFFGKGRCAECHPAPYYTDNTMHNMQTERFLKPQMINGRMASQDGPIKTFPLRGLRESPPYLHDRRLLTIEDTVEFFNLVTGVKLSEQEKKDLVAFLRCL